MKPLPTLTFSQYLAGGKQKQAFLKTLRETSKEVGFFYLDDHGLDTSIQKNTFELMHSFFALPAEEKLSIEMKHSPHFRGYSKVGSELTLGEQDKREQFDFMREEPTPYVHGKSPIWLKMRGSNQWPAGLPRMKQQLLAFQDKMTELSVLLLKAFAESLDQNPNVFDAGLSELPHQHTKLIRYPKQPHGSNQGVGAHKDSGFLTLLIQDEMSGLEVETDEGWLAVPPKPGTLIVNIGELLELASDGYLKATVHRVVSPQSDKDRYSCAFFLWPKLDTNVPLLSLPEHLKKQAHGPDSDPNNPLFYQVGENILKGRLRSHPDVAELHYTVHIN
ncbi:isopenicillin N synthase family oxygenase [Parashewanella curva]|uniref:2-oxoglutarate-dependent ethylene/succinate-forming enzyme n=1 Tax=Parashewanella curva TaxID=2338552 RepID=A0A3L8PWL0_9GAMM|nr:2-oxoglutarate and iron-dependent oxygenase domain-containing protein [Parashewanella curva]RLV59837.1 isopenicillin N synthase family oxygenase [Parashewanella curva]